MWPAALLNWLVTLTPLPAPRGNQFRRSRSIGWPATPFSFLPMFLPLPPSASYRRVAARLSAAFAKSATNYPCTYHCRLSFSPVTRNRLHERAQRAPAAEELKRQHAGAATYSRRIIDPTRATLAARACFIMPKQLAVHSMHIGNLLSRQIDMAHCNRKQCWLDESEVGRELCCSGSLRSSTPPPLGQS